MKEIQLKNFKVITNDEKISISDIANTWELSITILSPHFRIINEIIHNKDYNLILENYCYMNFLSAQNVFFNKEYLESMTNIFTKNFEFMSNSLLNNDDIDKISSDEN